MEGKTLNQGEHLHAWRANFIDNSGARKLPVKLRREMLYEEEGPVAALPIKDDDDRFDIEAFPSPSDCEACPICDLQFEPESRQKLDAFAYSERVSDENAQQIISTLITSIDETRTAICERLKTHGDNLLKRWQKSRNGVLHTKFSASGMELKSWPQLSRYLQYDWGWHEKRQYRNAFLIPQLNAETLTDDTSRFLRLVFNRTTFSPAEYFWQDRRALRFVVMRGLVEKSFNPRCMVTDGDERGTLIPWNRNRMHGEEICGFPVARIVLESQLLLMQTMRSIIEDVLKDLKQGSGNAKWQEAGENGFGGRSDHPILVLPYGAPQRFEVLKLGDMAVSRYEAIFDHLKDLQTDPYFMQAVFHEVPGTAKILQSSDADVTDEAIFWAESSRNVFVYDFIRAVDWVELRQRLEEVEKTTNADSPATGQQDLQAELTGLSRMIASLYIYWTSDLAEQCLHHFPGLTKPPAERQDDPDGYFLQELYLTPAGRRDLYAKDWMAWALLEIFMEMDGDPFKALDSDLLFGVLATEFSLFKQRARLDARAPS